MKQYQNNAVKYVNDNLTRYHKHYGYILYLFNNYDFNKTNIQNIIDVADFFGFSFETMSRYIREGLRDMNIYDNDQLELIIREEVRCDT